MVQWRQDALVILALALAALLLAASAAQAAFPGANGRLALNFQPVQDTDRAAGWTMNANGTDQRNVVPTQTLPNASGLPLRNVRSALRYSPDGRRVVYTWFPNSGTCTDPIPGRPTQLRIANADGTGVRDLTQILCGSALNGAVTLRNEDAAPGWSPDGARVVFASRRRCLQQRDPQCM